jgi:hypothetical protein
MKYIVTLIAARMIVAANTTRSPSPRDSLMAYPPMNDVINRNLSGAESQDD